MKKYKKLIITTIYLFVLNIVFSLMIYKTLTFSYIIFYFLESTLFSCIVNLISYPFKEKINKIITIILLTAITILYIAQYVHYGFYDCFFSTYSLVNGGQVFGFLSAILKEVLEHIKGILLMLFLLVITIVFMIKINNEKKKKQPLIMTIIALISLLLIGLFVQLSNNTIYSKKNLLDKTNSEVKNNMNFGLLLGMTIDLKRYISTYEEEFILTTKTKNVLSQKDKQNYNITDINFSTNNKNNKINKLNKYFSLENATNKNEYTDIFKDKNLIFITAESLYFNAINKETTPTLYKMMKEGLEFTNFYTPIYYASTSDGEYANLTGIIPKEGTWSFLASKNNSYPYTYSNFLKANNYNTYSYHNGEYNFYNRDVVMPNFGYDSYIGCGNGLENKINCNLWPQSDKEMFQKTFMDYKKSKHFMVYYMTISTHLPHNFKTNDMAKKHQSKVKNLNYSKNTKAYISATIELDQALENLLSNLKKENLLKDTVIVLTPDHYPYGLSTKELNEISKINTPYDKYKSGLIIYNEELKHTVIDKYASNIDILPTILNMFGAKYDSRILIGKDIMSESEGTVIFNDRSFLTNKGFYNEKTNKFTYFDKNTTNHYINKKRTETFNKVNASNMLLETNYYKYIEKEEK